MEADEPRVKDSGTIRPLVDDLSLFSETELEERMALLNREIDRCKVALEAKKGARGAAESVFRGL